MTNNVKDALKNHHSGDGHRQRVKDDFVSAAVEASSEKILLELMLFAIYPRQDVKPIVKKVLHCFGNLRTFFSTSKTSMYEVLSKDEKYLKLNENSIRNLYFLAKLMKEAILITIKQKIYEPDSTIFNSWNEIVLYLRHRFGSLMQENLIIIFLASNNKLLKIETMSTGTINEVRVYDREICKAAIEIGATSIVIAHNHFSGNVDPSDSDIDITKRIIQSAKIFGIEVLDHIIFSRDNHFSFKENLLIFGRE